MTLKQLNLVRTVTRLDRLTSTKVLLLQCGWLSVRQLMIYHSLVLLYKTIKHKKPEFLHQKVTSGSHKPRTKQATAAKLAAAGAPDPPSIDRVGAGTLCIGITNFFSTYKLMLSSKLSNPNSNIGTQLIWTNLVLYLQSIFQL